MIDNTNISPEQMDALCLASYQLLQTMSNIYGSDPAYEMFQKLEEVLGPEVKSNLFLRMLNSSYLTAGIRFTFKSGNCLNKINMIKAVRSFADSGMSGYQLGLKEAKDIIDASCIGVSSINFTKFENRNAFMKELIANNGIIV